ncbi:response regulator transcription factor [Lentzea cavernae]|uniref:DNA-binding response regulator n=1 Tax=Lentzea cavernae TaxID=2020703 RepID=A0ABQ3MQ77_9PSEU|nr:response regulator transcription factor [Lentzea cavernae]GHH56424.1 DNA-binding response regulator [Lentzea cavernae]
MIPPPFAGQRVPSALIASTDARVITQVTESLVATGVEVVHHAVDADALRQVLRAEPAGHLALVDLAMIGPHGVNLVWNLRGAGWHRVLAVISRYDNAARTQVVASGVDGVLMRSLIPETGGDWMSRALNGELHTGDLTVREVEVMRLVASGHTNAGVAKALSLSPLTVKSHLERISRKLGVGDRAAMVLQSLRRGVIW